MRRLLLLLPLPRGKPRVDDREVLSSIINDTRHGQQWRNATAA